MKQPTKIQTEIFNLIGWLQFHRRNRIVLDMVQLPCNVSLLNNRIDFAFNFNLDNLKELRMANALLCLWANKGASAKTDYADQSIFDLDDLTKLSTG